MYTFKKSARQDRKYLVEKLAQDAEEAAKIQNMGTLYRITKTLSGGFRSTDTPERKLDGKLASRIDTTFRWATCCLIYFIPIVKPFLTH